MSKTRELTELENELLATVWKDQPCTRYWVKKVYESSPVGARRDSAGSVYPAINRLVKRGYLKKKPIPSDRRRSYELTCTADGLTNIRKWLLDISALHSFPIDPLRKKSFFLGAMTKKQRHDWLRRSIQICDEQLLSIRQFNEVTAEKSTEFADLGSNIASEEIRARRRVMQKYLKKQEE